MKDGKAMKFIPQRLKNIFSRKGRKQPAKPAPAAAQQAETPKAPKQPETPAPVLPWRSPEELKRHRQDEGYYLIDMEIKYATEVKDGPHKDARVLMITSPDISLSLALVSNSPLAGAGQLAKIVNAAVKLNFGMEDTAVYFRARPTSGAKSGFYIDPADDFTGLPPVGSQFQIVLIPKDCAWRPLTSIPRKTPPGTSSLLRPPGQ
ncbi:MAG: hypothetical protein GC185_10555 [Alphaproteobacteria bacterium]|nr:hypothetical protein [Alphaproteobacteria bacterium]